MVRLAVRTLSELCVTVGSLIVLLVVYLLFWTGVRADNTMSDEVAKLQNQWARTPLTATAPATPAPQTQQSTPSPSATPTPPVYRDGQPFAIMYIPRFGADWHKPVIEGTSTSDLQRGVAHYTGTARLGAVGNFAVAGHRRTYGNPFEAFAELRPGDKVVLTDGVTWYTYVIDDQPYLTLPNDIGVINPIPAPLDTSATPYTSPGRYLTLTTCDPPWGHSHRLIAWGHLESTQPVEQGMPRALLS
ncbi:class E sortase [Streptomyces sp. RB6PN25]|uniref:Class E sortase n=1 Tax=Streptomyces humicola TaxID=2953240 RepID=A0ABT1PZZ2_9ACTN|nr:class E sortase [Streptomyces humicola]MCQ4083238.1 class E sortase [Streptomyces humicola]